MFDLVTRKVEMDKNGSKLLEKDELQIYGV